MKKRDDIYLAQIQERIALIQKHLKGINRAKFLKSSLHKSAVVRELEVIGEAAKLISDETKRKFPAIPWPQMIGMRNRLIHGYFDVDETIVWEVASAQLPALEKTISQAFLATAPSIHPWRHCPAGHYFVREHSRKVGGSTSGPTGLASVRAHCRKNPTGKDQLYPEEILLISEGQFGNALPLPSTMKAPKNANDFDRLIALWTKYWNAVFSPKEPLSPNLVKALFFSESSFNLKAKDQKITTGNYARGPMQISDETRKVLSDEKGELSDHFLTLTVKDIKKPEIALAAAVRWLFHKQNLASRYLGREATWDEAVAHYKGYLRMKGDFRKKKGMIKFLETLDAMSAGGKKR